MNEVKSSKYFPDFPEIDCCILECSGDEYHTITKLLNIHNEHRAFTAIKEVNSVIVLNLEGIEPEILNIVVAHELGHVYYRTYEGNNEEEIVDRFALTLLNEEDTGCLKDNWKFRHGVDYEKQV